MSMETPFFNEPTTNRLREIGWVPHIGKYHLSILRLRGTHPTGRLWHHKSLEVTVTWHDTGYKLYCSTHLRSAHPWTRECSTNRLKRNHYLRQLTYMVDWNDYWRVRRLDEDFSDTIFVNKPRHVFTIKVRNICIENIFWFDGYFKRKL